MKALPEPLVFLSGYPWSLIAHPDARDVALFGYANLDGSPFWGVFERVGQIVGDHLADAVRINEDRHGLVHPKAERDRASWRGLALLFGRLADNGHQIS